jgi:hypothetical protein
MANAPERRNTMKVKDILSDPSKWTQGAPARDQLGEECPPASPQAVKYCVLGAIAKAYPKREDRIAAAWRVRDAVIDLGWRCRNPLAISVWNDYQRRTFEEVRQVIEKADV